MSQKAHPTGILDLPLELRREIYRHCLIRKGFIDAYFVLIDEYSFSEWGIRDNKKSLLLVSKQISEEASEILYGENTFSYLFNADSGYYFKKNFSVSNIARIRKLCVIMQDSGCQYPNDMPDMTLWSPILARLTRLVVVAKQPLEPRTYWNAPSFESELREWESWFGATVGYISQQVPSTVVVEVDDDDRAETDALVKKYFADRHRKVCTIRGDLLFNRRAYSVESGYFGGWRLRPAVIHTVAV